jgi:hypothetical protein
MSLPKFLQPYLASYDLSRLDKNSPAVAKEIITQVLNEGDEKAVNWVFDNFTLDQIRQSVSQPQRGVWFEESLNYWSKMLKINDIKNQSGAILNINPT